MCKNNKGLVLNLKLITFYLIRKIINFADFLFKEKL